MTIVRQVTGVLAWAGLVVVIAVPAAELVLSKLNALTSPEVATATVAPTPVAVTPAVPVAVKVATVPSQPVAVLVAPKPAGEPFVAPVAVASTAVNGDSAPADPVKDYLASGKPLPSYLTPSAKGASTGPTPEPVASAAPAVVQTPVAATDALPAATDPTTTGTVSVTTQPAAAPEDDTTVAVAPPVPMPASARPKIDPAATVTEADLKDWKSGSLEDYLRQHGLLNGAATAAPAGN